MLSSWAADPAPFYAVVVMLFSAAVERRMRQVARALQPWCKATTPATPHVTLAACGVRPAVAPGERCEVVVGGADAFTSAAFLHAAGVEGLREPVLRAVGEVDPAPVWVPHVTVGTFRWSLSTPLVAQRLATMRGMPPIVAPGRVAVVRVDRRTGLIAEV